MDIKPIASALGAEVFDCNLVQEKCDERWQDLYNAFLTYSVLAIRDQQLTPESLVAVARYFGSPQPDSLQTGVEGVMEVTRIVKEPDEVENFGHQWHMDMSFLEAPPKASLLYGVEVPPVGGDTLFASLTMSYACLSDGMKALLSGLTGIHENWPNDLSRFKGVKAAARNYRRRAREWPMIAPHPETDKLRLMVSPYYAREIEGMTMDESQALFTFLNAWATKTEFTCRIRWQPGTLTIWDNRAVIHDVPSDDFGARLAGKGFRRVMHRVTVF
jgi:taurine dioxygenase